MERGTELQFVRSRHAEGTAKFGKPPLRLTVYRSLAGTAPVYLADECTLVTAAGRRPLRSVDLSLIHI